MEILFIILIVGSIVARMVGANKKAQQRNHPPQPPRTGPPPPQITYSTAPRQQASPLPQQVQQRQSGYSPPPPAPADVRPASLTEELAALFSAPFMSAGPENTPRQVPFSAEEVFTEGMEFHPHGTHSQPQTAPIDSTLTANVVPSMTESTLTANVASSMTDSTLTATVASGVMASGAPDVHAEYASPRRAPQPAFQEGFQGFSREDIVRGLIWSEILRRPKFPRARV